jgi:hypothetical protein
MRLKLAILDAHRFLVDDFGLARIRSGLEVLPRKLGVTNVTVNRWGNVGAAEVEDDGEPFEEKKARPTAQLREQTAQSEKIDNLIWANLEDIRYGG